MIYRISLLLILLASQAGAASPLADAERAYLDGDYQRAVELFTPHAEGGDVSAQYNLGVIFEDYLKDYDQAFYWTEKAAVQGDADAQIRLALMYEDGIGTAVDVEKAVLFYRRSAEQGNVHGQSNLADLYLNGRSGVERNNGQGVFWLTKAADNGHPHAQYVLGVMFINGNVVAKDMTKAEHYLRQAARQGHDEALAFFTAE